MDSEGKGEKKLRCIKAATGVVLSQLSTLGKNYRPAYASNTQEYRRLSMSAHTACHLPMNPSIVQMVIVT